MPRCRVAVVAACLLAAPCAYAQTPTSLPTHQQLATSWMVVETRGNDTTWLDSTRVTKVEKGVADVWLFLDSARGRMVNLNRLDCNKLAIAGFLSTTWFGADGSVVYNEKFDSLHVVPGVTKNSMLLAMRACRLLQM